jgi:hypothetical protein
VSSIRRHIYCKGKLAALAAAFFLSLLITQGRTWGQEDSLQYISGQTTFFSGVDYSLQWRQGDPPARQSASMLFVIYHANRAVVKIPVVPSRKKTGTAHAREVVFQVDFQYPELKPGNAIEAQAVILTQKNNDTWEKVFQSPFYFFPRQFEAGYRSNALEGQIGIIDRSSQQALARILQEMDIPFSRVSSIHDFRGKWLLCSGLEFNGGPSLFPQLLELVKKGISIAVFPPCTGVFPVPSYQPGLQIALGDQRLAKKMDARINLVGSEAEFQGPAVSFLLKNSGGEITVHCSREAAGFHWLEISCERGTLIFCGWNVGGMFMRNPSARLLLTKIVNYRSLEAPDEQN